ncbi:hypothetical protein Q7P37_009517 [Cladosporium fusiforme]
MDAEEPFEWPRDANDTSPALPQSVARSVLKTAITKLCERPEGIFFRYQKAGHRWHQLPMSTRHSSQLDSKSKSLAIIGFLVQHDGKIAEYVTGYFESLGEKVNLAEQVVEEEGENVGILLQTFIALTEEVKVAEKIVYMFETAVDEAIAVTNSLFEQGLVPQPDPRERARVSGWEQWQKALVEWVGGEE